MLHINLGILKNYIEYYGLGFFKNIIDVSKYVGLIYYNDFHIFPITDKLSVSSLPRQYYQPIIGQFDVVIGIINPTEYGNQEIEWLKTNNLGIRYYNIPVLDYTAPQKEHYESLFRILDNHPNAKVLIHCYAGKGRSNCGVAAYLMYRHKHNAQDAIRIVETKNPRSSMNRWQKRSLEDLDQSMDELGGRKEI